MKCLVRKMVKGIKKWRKELSLVFHTRSQFFTVNTRTFKYLKGSSLLQTTAVTLYIKMTAVMLNPSGAVPVRFQRRTANNTSVSEERFPPVRSHRRTVPIRTDRNTKYCCEKDHMAIFCFSLSVSETFAFPASKKEQQIQC